MSTRTLKKASKQNISSPLTGEDTTTNNTNPKAPRRRSARLAAVQAKLVSKGSEEEILQEFESPQSDYTPSPYSKPARFADWEPEGRQVNGVSPKFEALSPGFMSSSPQVPHAEISEHDLQYSNSRFATPYWRLEEYAGLGMEGTISNEENGNGIENAPVPPQTPFPAYQQPYYQGNYERRSVVSGDPDTSCRKEQKRCSLSAAQETSCGFSMYRIPTPLSVQTDATVPAADVLMPDSVIMNRIKGGILNIFEKRSYEEVVNMVAETRRAIYDTLRNPFSAGAQSPPGQVRVNPHLRRMHNLKSCSRSRMSPRCLQLCQHLDSIRTTYTPRDRPMFNLQPPKISPTNSSRLPLATMRKRCTIVPAKVAMVPDSRTFHMSLYTDKLRPGWQLSQALDGLAATPQARTTTLSTRSRTLAVQVQSRVF